MYQLDDIAFRYLPRTLIQYWAENPDARPVWGHWLDGSLMHCDVTGFTAMSEKLAEVGKEGAELMAGVLNEFFERMLAIAISWGGIQMKFGGDAMLLYFPENDHAYRATACGLEMQSAMRDFSRVKVKNDYHKLLMRIGVHSGKFYVCSVGQVGAKIGQGEGLLHYFIVGHDVNKAADTEPMAEPGQVVVSDTTYHLLTDSENKIYKSDHKKIWLVKKIKAKKRRLKYFDDDALPHHILERYLMKPIAEGLSSGKSEHRRVTIIFIYVTGIASLLDDGHEEHGLSQLDAYTNMVINTAEKYGGYFAASDASEHGDKLIVLFGAPVIQDKQESSAMHFALEIKEKKEKLNVDLEHQIGINTGYVFCGEIGSTARREYTVIGDSVNLSARLMASADVNEIIVSDYSASKANNEFVLEKLEPIMVKGKKDPIPICKLLQINNTVDDALSLNESVFVGRDIEIAKLNEYYSQVNEECQSLILLGEAGIGKTKLAYEFINFIGRQCDSAITFCKSFNKHLAYSCVRKIILDIINCNESSNPAEIKNNMKKCVAEYADKYSLFFPLLADVIGFKEDDNDVTGSLDNKTKREKRLEIFYEIITNHASHKPLILFIDNIQWMDRLSEEIISSIIRDNCKNLMLISTARTKEDVNSISECLTENTILVDNLDKIESISLIEELSGIKNNKLNRDIYSRTQGNPLFIIELIHSGSLETGEMPDSLYDIVMSKLDKLRPENRNFLQSASVAGQSFKSEEIISF